MRRLITLLLLLACLLPHSQGWAAITSVAYIDGGSADGNTFTTSSLNSTGANFLICAMTSYELAAVPTLSDSKGNTWTALTNYQIATLVRTRLYYVAGATVGSGHTFTATTSAAAYPSLACQAFAGVHATPADQDNGAAITPATTSGQPGSVTPSQDNELLVTAIGFANDNQDSAAGINSSFTLSGYLPSLVAQYWGVALAYKIQTTAGAENPTWSWTGSTRAVTPIASFKAASATDQTFGFLKRRAQ